ncbi:MAG: hypothetical protein ACFFDU_10755 [Candidatus Thorarchaeota archaeon]
MKRLPIALLLLATIVIPLIIPDQLASTEDCYVQIISLTLNKSSLEIGEKLQITLVYDLYYDQMDPLGIGSVSVSISVQGEVTSLSSYEFTRIGFNIQESMTFDVSPYNWTPYETGQTGLIQVEGWVQDTMGSMFDSVQQQFSIQRSNLILEVNPLPSQLLYHGNYNLSGALFNPHNYSIYVPNHPLMISILQEQVTLQSWTSETNFLNNFTQPINSTLIGTGEFQCQITALDSDDYKSTHSNLSLFIDNASLSISAILNTSIVQTYYPSMNNCSVLVSVYLHCQEAKHDLEEANVTCYLGNKTTNLDYIEPNYFSAELTAPSVAGQYLVYITALTPNHNPINCSLPLSVTHRRAQITFLPNCTEAAYGDTIEFSLQLVDYSSHVPISDRICSIYLYNQSTWNLLAQVIVDENGFTVYQWHAQNVGNEDFRFKVVFQGSPEFSYSETESIVTNTHDLRFMCNTTVAVIRPNDVNFILKLTNLEYQPLFNVSVSLVEDSSNSTWCTALTNSSGYVTLSWLIDENFILGPHDLLIIAKDGTTTLGTIQIIMIVYEQTVLELV